MASVKSLEGRFLAGLGRSPGRREAILDAFERSGVSGRAFAKQAEVGYSTLMSWRQQRRRALGLGDKRPAALTFVEAVVEEAPGSPGSPARAEAPEAAVCVEVETPGGYRVRVSRREELALAVAFLRALEGRGDAEL